MNITEKTWGFKRYREWLLRKFRTKFHSDCIEKYQNGKWSLTDTADVSVSTLHRKLKLGPSFCIYYRVVLVYSPMYAIFHSLYTPLVLLNTLVYGFILAILTNPVFCAGEAAEFTLAMIIAVLLILMVVLIFLIGSGIKELFYRVRSHIRNLPPVEGPSMFKDVIKPYMVSKKKHICPMVTFEEDGKVEIL